jgi:hypothetical protein
MTANEENKVSTYHAVDVVLTDNQNVWQSLPAFVSAVSKFRTKLADIQTISQARNASTKGVTADKQSAREVMIAAAWEVAHATAAYAADIGSGELLAKVDQTESELRRARDTDVITLCQGIQFAANANVANLADFGVTPGDVDGVAGQDHGVQRHGRQTGLGPEQPAGGGHVVEGGHHGRG